jgi:hypothetical protein
LPRRAARPLVCRAIRLRRRSDPRRSRLSGRASTRWRRRVVGRGRGRR